MKVFIKPLRGKVFIIPEPHKPADTSLVIPESAMNRDMPSIGTVLSIGGRRKTKNGVVIDHEFKPGDRVFFRKFSGLWVDVRGRKIIQIEQGDVLALLPTNGCEAKS